MPAVAGAMAFYEWTRIKAGRPILQGHQAVILYWVAYLTLFGFRRHDRDCRRSALGQRVPPLGPKVCFGSKTDIG
jgi:hypothetical protein